MIEDKSKKDLQLNSTRFYSQASSMHIVQLSPALLLHRIGNKPGYKTNCKYDFNDGAA